MQNLPGKLRWFILACLLVASLCSALALRSYWRADAMPASNKTILPPTILWAWERPEKLNFIDSRKVGVAFLAQTIYLRGDRVVARPRLQPLEVASEVKVVAVARIETDRVERPTFSEQQLADALNEISKLASLRNVTAVQLDFDATTSERAFYRQLLVKLKPKLPETTLLSITALASWCQGDNWLEDLPIDEAVPMLFRMGVECNQFRAQQATGEQFNAKPCRTSAGVSTDEPLAGLANVQRLYVFSPEPWSADTLKQTMETYQR